MVLVNIFKTWFFGENLVFGDNMGFGENMEFKLKHGLK